VFQSESRGRETAVVLLRTSRGEARRIGFGASVSSSPDSFDDPQGLVGDMMSSVQDPSLLDRIVSDIETHGPRGLVLEASPENPRISEPKAFFPVLESCHNGVSLLEPRGEAGVSGERVGRELYDDR
jgi:hypothetical protein